jgi:hypothetical protein
MTPPSPPGAELRQARLRGQSAAHVHWTVTEAVAGRFSVAAATSHLVRLSELHADHLAGPRPIVQGMPTP